MYCVIIRQTTKLSAPIVRLCSAARELRRAVHETPDAPHCSELAALEAAVVGLEAWPEPLGADPAVTRATFVPKLEAARRPCRSPGSRRDGMERPRP